MQRIHVEIHRQVANIEEIGVFEKEEDWSSRETDISRETAKILDSCCERLEGVDIQGEHDFDNPNALLSEGGVLAVWSKASPKRRITPVAVASRVIEVSVKGAGEESGGGDGGEGGVAPGRGSKGRRPSPAPMYDTG